MNAKRIFGTDNLYKILKIESSAPIAEVKKSYYKLARLYHPDKAAESDKAIANDKFNILHQAYLILSDPEKRNKYDAGHDILFARATVSAQWEYFVKPISDEDIDIARKDYQNSELEKSDIQREYKLGNGSMTHLLNNIPFMRIEDEQRVINIIRDMIDCGLAPKLKLKKISK